MKALLELHKTLVVREKKFEDAVLKDFQEKLQQDFRKF